VLGWGFQQARDAGYRPGRVLPRHEYSLILIEAGMPEVHCLTQPSAVLASGRMPALLSGRDFKVAYLTVLPTERSTRFAKMNRIFDRMILPFCVSYPTCVSPDL
jgi:hypothetical protein